MGSPWRICKSQVAECLQKRVNRYFLLFLSRVCHNCFSFASPPSFLFPVFYADGDEPAALRNGCIKRLRQIQAGLQARNEFQTSLMQTDPQPQPQQQPQMQAHVSSNPSMWSQHQLEDCSVLLLTHLMELQEVKASALLPALMDKVSQDEPRHIQSKDSTLF